MRVGAEGAALRLSRSKDAVERLRPHRSAADRELPLPGRAVRRRRGGRARAGPQARAGRRLSLSRRRPPSPRQADASRCAACSRRPAWSSARTAASAGFAAKEAGPSPPTPTRKGSPPTPSWWPRAPGRPCSTDQLGCKVPIQPGKGYSLTMPRPSICPVHPMIFPETRVAVTPFQSGYRLGSTMEFSGYDTTLNPRPAPASPRRRGALPARAGVRADSRRLVRLAADDLGQPADHRPQPVPGKRDHCRRPQHARPVDGPRHGQARLRDALRHRARSSIPSRIASAGFDSHGISRTTQARRERPRDRIAQSSRLGCEGMTVSDHPQDWTSMPIKPADRPPALSASPA